MDDVHGVFVGVKGEKQGPLCPPWLVSPQIIILHKNFFVFTQPVQTRLENPTRYHLEQISRKQTLVDDDSSLTNVSILKKKNMNRKKFLFQLPQEESSPDSEITSEVIFFGKNNRILVLFFLYRWMINLMMMQLVVVSIVIHMGLVSHLEQIFSMNNNNNNNH